jgi:pimeloyl-ACP methyl ester carboxylesterase
VWSWRSAIERAATGQTALLRAGQVHYRTWSRDGRPSLLFVHGFRGHSHWWDWIAPSFADEYDVVAMDLSGMGDSAWRTSYDPDCFALDILGLIDELAARPAVVVGHSFGGGSLLRACAIDSQSPAPRRIAHAIVVDSWVRLRGHPSPDPGPIGGGRHYPDFETARSRFRLSPPQPVMDDAMLDYLARHSLRQIDGMWRWKFDPALPGPGSHDNAPLLRRIATTTDIVYGAKSSIVTRERALACVAELTHGRGPVEIPDAGHHVMLDQPVALIATLKNLLASRRR